MRKGLFSPPVLARTISLKRELLLASLLATVTSLPTFAGSVLAIDANKDTACLSQAIGIIQANYVDSFAFDPARDTCLETLLWRLDPYSNYLDPTEFRYFNSKFSNQGSIGYGIEYVSILDTPRVYSVEPTSVAFQEGVCIGDRLIEVGEASSIGWAEPDDSIHAICKGGRATLTFIRPSGRIYSVDVAGTWIPAPTHLVAFMLTPKVMYLLFDGFWRGVAEQIERKLDSLQAGNPGADYLILDVRQNHGGLVDEAVKVANLFCESSVPFVSVRGSYHKVGEHNYFGGSVEAFPTLKITVLIGSQTWSGAELFAGCMQDLGRALLVGEPSGGKGLVMQTFDLKNGGGLLMTTGRYFLPSGRLIQVPYEDGIQMSRIPTPQKWMLNLDHAYERPFACDSLVFQNTNEHPLYGLGAIVPDVLVPDFLGTASHDWLTRKQLRELCYEFVDHCQPKILAFKSYGEFEEAIARSPFGVIKRNYLAADSSEVSRRRRLLLTEYLCNIVLWRYYGIGSLTPAMLRGDESVECALKIMEAHQARVAGSTKGQKSPKKNDLSKR